MTFDRYRKDRTPLYNRKDLHRLISDLELQIESMEAERPYWRARNADLAQKAEKDLGIKAGTLTYDQNVDAAALGSIALYQKHGYVIFEERGVTPADEKFESRLTDEQIGVWSAVFKTPDVTREVSYKDPEFEIAQLQDKYILARLNPAKKFLNVLELETKLGGHCPHIDELDSRKITIPLSREENIDFVLTERQVKGLKMADPNKEADSDRLSDR